MTHATAALELVTGLLADDDRYGSDAAQAPTVVPVVHDEFHGDRALLEAALRHYGGQLLIADEAVTSVDGSPDSGLVDVVAEVCARYPLDITLNTSGGRVTIATADPASANESHRIVLSAIAWLLSDELSGAPLTVLAVPAEGLDATRLALLWELLVHQAPPLLPRDIRTFVPLLAGTVSIRDHCSGHPSARWAIRSGIAHKRRRDPTALAGQVARLISDLSRPLVLFLGAGASANARIPQGDTVRDQAIQRLLGGNVASAEIAERFHGWVIEEARLLPDEDAMDQPTFIRLLTLERVLHEEFRDLLAAGRTRADSPTFQALHAPCDQARLRTPPGREAIWRLMAEHPRLIIVTVNFDVQVEDSCPVSHTVYATRSDFDDAASHVTAFLGGDRSRGVPVLKIHGTILDPDSLVADLAQTVSGLPPEVRSTLEAAASHAPLDWVWIGCSMRDRDVNQWMRTQQDAQLLDWWVDPLPGPGIAAFVRETRRPEVQVEAPRRVVSEGADAFLVALAERVEALAGAP